MIELIHCYLISTSCHTSYVIMWHQTRYL